MTSVNQWTPRARRSSPMTSGAAISVITANRRSPGTVIRMETMRSEAPTAVATAVWPLGKLWLPAVAIRSESGGRGRSTTALRLQNRTSAPA